MKMDVLGKTNMKSKVDGLTHIVSDKFFIADLNTKVVSIGRLQDKGLTILIQHGYMNIYHTHKGVIVHTEMTIRMFVLLTSSLP